jgi:hypothetical protein
MLCVFDLTKNEGKELAHLNPDDIDYCWSPTGNEITYKSERCWQTIKVS